MANTSYADYIRHWGQIDDRTKVNPELANFEPLRAQLEIERLGLVEATNQQAALKSATQDTSRKIEGHVERGRVLATRLRDAIKATYGRDHEKLTEFGVPVRRPRATSTEEKKKKKQPENGQSPTQAARSQTESTS
ncbi:MAG: hypothetical protein ACJ76J_01530 [Thermoanaerobaculia bacterium]